MIEPMFNVGDEVMIRPDLKQGGSYKIYANDDMEAAAGSIMTIEHVSTDNIAAYYSLEESPWNWSEDMLMPIIHELDVEDMDTSGLINILM